MLKVVPRLREFFFQKDRLMTRVGIRDGKLGWFREKCPMDLALACMTTPPRHSRLPGRSTAGVRCRRQRRAECDKLAVGGFGFDMTFAMRVEGVKRIIQYRSRGWNEKKNRSWHLYTFGDVIFYAALGIIATSHLFSFTRDDKELSFPFAIPTLLINVVNFMPPWPPFPDLVQMSDMQPISIME